MLLPNARNSHVLDCERRTIMKDMGCPEGQGTARAGR